MSEELKTAVFEIKTKKTTYSILRILAILNRDYGIQETKDLVHRFMKEKGFLIKKSHI